MKQIIFCLLMGCTLLIPISSSASTNENHTVIQTTNSSKQEEPKVLVQRLKEIYSMDKSQLSRKEKKALRQEVRLIDKKLQMHYSGVYISVAGIIIIILLLLILL